MTRFDHPTEYSPNVSDNALQQTFGQYKGKIKQPMRILFFLILLIPSLISNAQEEYLLQPQKFIKENDVYKLYKYEGKAQQLTQIIEFDSLGRVVKVIKPVLTKKRDLNIQDIKPEYVTYFQYNSNGKLINIADTVYQNDDYLSQMTFIFFDSTAKNEFLNRPEFLIKKTDLTHSSDGEIMMKKHYNENNKLYYVKEYSYQPYSIKTQFFQDSLVIEEFTMEYEKEIYPKNFFGYNLNPLVKDSVSNIQYSDYKQAKKQEHIYLYDNKFDSSGRLIESNVKMNDIRGQRNAVHLYNYNEKGLLEQVKEIIYSEGKESFVFLEFYEYEYK